MAPTTFSRRELRRLFGGWARRNLKTVITSTAVVILMLFLATVFLIWYSPLGNFRWYLMGLTHALLLGAAPVALFMAFLAINPEAMRQLRGAWGEENTREVLKSAKHRRLVWGWADSIELAYGDIDHLVVTRRGGLVAIDSKWRNTFNPADRDGMARSAEKARLRANGIVDTVVRAGARGRRSAGQSVRIRPVVVIWGALQSEIPESANAHGVDFVPGYRLKRYLKDLRGDPIDRAAASGLLRRVNEFRDNSKDRRTKART
ncbi:hypothetical protein GL325_09350 [Aeromicrobium sp. 636]|uniref:NERD domain-containing protein n=1 Tax=Aeromicrobium senzhongii TaxID=2663859 RepID=A0A8I0EWC0_9ACTN|nr:MULTISPECIES: nuclease-related domain-containing protein [Aeromicrobium]MBC9226526.1 NERD domain-containing protein [Aeromicrobium senzhongii]MCQ3998629.1 hypothetical protein [Aeromicrobium sp. 636]